MALKFLNKKGWHTGSLRNIENVWKAEQKHGAEQKKLEELRKQIQEERERAEFRQLQERAGLAPRQERLDFLYESGLGVGKGSGEVFKALQAPPSEGSSAAAAAAPESSGSAKAAAPGALFEDKPQSANDAWRKLHSDPLLLIRQREQDALNKIKNNPIKMATIRKSAEAEKKQKEKGSTKEKREKKEKRKHHHSKSKHDRHSSRADSDSDKSIEESETQRKRSRPTEEKQTEHRSRHDRQSSKAHLDSEGETIESDGKRKRDRRTPDRHIRENLKGGRHRDYNSHVKEERRGQYSYDSHRRDSARGSEKKQAEMHNSNIHQGTGYNHCRTAPKLSVEERAAKLREMQLNAEVHEEQRWKHLRSASEAEAVEANKEKQKIVGPNFLDAAHKSIYGTEKGGSSTIEESVRRRAYFSQGSSAAQEGNAFRR